MPRSPGDRQALIEGDLAKTLQAGRHVGVLIQGFLKRACNYGALLEDEVLASNGLRQKERKSPEQVLQK